MCNLENESKFLLSYKNKTKQKRIVVSHTYTRAICYEFKISHSSR